MPIPCAMMLPGISSLILVARSLAFAFETGAVGVGTFITDNDEQEVIKNINAIKQILFSQFQNLHLLMISLIRWGVALLFE